MKIQNNQSEHLKPVCHYLTLLKGNLRLKTKPSPNERTQKTTPETLHPKARNPGKTDIATLQAPSPTPIEHDTTDANTAGQGKTKAQHPRCPMPNLPETRRPPQPGKGILLHPKSRCYGNQNQNYCPLLNYKRSTAQA